MADAPASQRSGSGAGSKPKTPPADGGAPPSLKPGSKPKTPPADGGAPPPAAPPADKPGSKPKTPPSDGGAPPADKAPSQRDGAPSGGGGGAAGCDPAALAQQYQAEFQATFEGLKKRGVALQEQVTTQLAGGGGLEPIKAELLTYQDMSGDVPTPPAKVFQTFAWNTVLVFAASFAFFLGAGPLAGVVGLFFGGFMSAILVLGVIPAYVYYKLPTMTGSSDTEVRMFILGTTVLSGFLLGGGFGNTYYYAEPFAFFTPLAVALVFGFGAGALGSGRQTLLGASVGAGVAIHFVLGIVFGSLSLQYLFLVILYAAATFATLQFFFKGCTSAEAPTHLYMLTYATAYFWCKGLAFFLMGSSTPYDRSNEASSSSEAAK